MDIAAFRQHIEQLLNDQAYEQAQAALQARLATADELAERLVLYELQADVAAAQEDLTAAAETLGDAIGQARRAGVTPPPHLMLRLGHYLSYSAPQEAEKLFRRALEAAKADRDQGPYLIARALQELGTLQHRQHALEDAQASFREAINILQASEQQRYAHELLPELWLAQAAVSSKLLDYETCIAAAQEALHWYEENAAAFDLIAKAKLLIADYYRHFWQHDQAMVVYRELFIHAQDEESPYRGWQPMLLNRIGFIHEQRKYYTEAIRHYLSAFNMMREKGADMNDLRWTAQRIEDSRTALARRRASGQEEGEEGEG
jgi:tetratricopeptide (TPR) repeat protein